MCSNLLVLYTHFQLLVLESEKRLQFSQRKVRIQRLVQVMTYCLPSMNTLHINYLAYNKSELGIILR